MVNRWFVTPTEGVCLLFINLYRVSVHTFTYLGHVGVSHALNVTPAKHTGVCVFFFFYGKMSFDSSSQTQASECMKFQY